MVSVVERLKASRTYGRAQKAPLSRNAGEGSGERAGAGWAAGDTGAANAGPHPQPLSRERERGVNAAAGDDPKVQTGARIDIHQVSHWFGHGNERLQVLDDVDLNVAPGEFVALLGPSGCGKSTLLRLVAGLDQPASGEILQDGTPIAEPDPSRIVVFQDPTLYPWRRVWDNVALGLQAQGILAQQRHRVDDALRRVGLESFARAFPHQLSGGMAQRVALARALVNDPRLLVLDEPLGKLDSLTRLAMQSDLVELWQRSRFSALLVTHDVEEALFLAQRVIVFSQRPARIAAELKVDLPYPRHRGDPRLTELRHQALRHLGLDASW
ncbi:ABC transporter ATP-binding protein [Cupriavidus oxalaticus]|uniref:ABC transporter ATP-binding protein n=1 Tax=Cupriavidus oxalaticus TaxID=96344 RepID=UPI0040346A91